MIRTDSLQISPEILGLIAGIDEFKGAWRALWERRQRGYQAMGYQTVASGGLRLEFPA